MWKGTYQSLLAFAFVLLGVQKVETQEVLTFTYCKEVCVSQNLPIPEGITHMECMKQGMIAAIQWIEQNHPGYALKEWSCGKPHVSL